MRSLSRSRPLASIYCFLSELSFLSANQSTMLIIIKLNETNLESFLSLTDEAARASEFLQPRNTADEIAAHWELDGAVEKYGKDSPRLVALAKGYLDNNPGVVSRVTPRLEPLSIMSTRRTCLALANSDQTCIIGDGFRPHPGTNRKAESASIQYQ